MANKDVLDKKTLEKYRKQIKNDFEDHYKDELVKEISDKVSSEVKDNFNNSFKEELVTELSTDVKDIVKNDLVKEERRVYRHKSFKIFRLSIYVLVLLAVVGYGVYRLYVTESLNLMDYNYNPEKVVTTTPASNPEPKKDEPKIDYVAEYKSLVDGIKIYDSSLYKGTVKATDMKMINKLQMAYSTLSDTDKEVDGSIVTIKPSALRAAYIKLFGTDDFEPTSFNIYNINFVYSPNKNEFIAIINVPNTEDIKYEVYDGSVDENYIILKAYVAKIQDNKVYNVATDKALGDYTNGLNDYKTKLSTVTFRFTKDKNFYSITNE